ncbi:bifunctional diaminohydroxyphosphoribosylaminopyrimidine deaminase/5-amino-6-(5-phosphoribosylamino)uracil reductase RibD [Paraglaciecola psychrophila]|uniref:Riboflavin biosynthesis protein RibD n=1 Tax=Paraglaciecola psychrophila 170 TaxID=1129794 RepID=K6ZV84_9ALTE|nr:bifunctional diaminohydroxyphosphoribosylaminopyrimidine deaminase/5-amino-6-(5-phosphoribosylamino)uracil reductase RibD [Paraglaciecola psychrophila]AGH45986.1 riboflavin biosynthesis protein RibD [Paraglaciecola psychrophila 170]GAC39781.1 diaminohydroxyphosphoribosylaminopyrimidine deaminase [Paraglaciecola psychrophila 170]
MTEFSKIDHQMMARAIQLAKCGEYTTSPNPNVGCVISDRQGVILGEGWHKKAGAPHAEVHALQQAGEFSKGATAYVTLEPCSHYGKTPPCADALIEAGVTRVVAAMVDPNPVVSGKGLIKLQEAGIKTEHGLLQASAEQLNRGFIKRMRTGLPWVTVKLAASLDGKTALKNGISQWITGPQARQDVQRHRARSCAILSGSGTVIADNPMLNVRYSELNLNDDVLAQKDLRQPLRVLLDGRNQLPASLNCLRSFENNLAGNVLLVNGQPSEHLFEQHVSQWQAPFIGNKLDLNKVMTKLGEMQLNNIWVEAGGKLAGALLQNKLIDELILYQAPKLIGGAGQNLFDSIPIEVMDEVIELTWTDIRQVGSDIKMTALINN